MLVRLAVRVRAAGYVLAGIYAAALHARQVILAIVVRRALALAGRNSRAANTVRIADHTSRAFACVSALRIDAIRAVTAGIVRAFVHVDAAVLRVTLEAGLAHAPRWIARGALRVDAAWEAITGIYE